MLWTGQVGVDILTQGCICWQLVRGGTTVRAMQNVGLRKGRQGEQEGGGAYDYESQSHLDV